MSAPWLEGLNPSQYEAVTHGDGPLLVIAGAGTGKTRTLACRVACLIDRGVPPDRILLLTFTRRAAAEMLGRAGQMIGPTTSHVWGGTFHAVANRLLRVYARPMGLSPDFTVMDQGDAADMMSLLRNELGVARKDRRFPAKATLVRIYSLTVNANQKLSEVIKRHFPWCNDDLEGIRRIFEAYGQRKRETNVFDYDDLLLYWRALCNSSEVGDAAADRFEHILVDEYQDTNAIQAEILVGMRRNCANIMVVGDDAQSIYSFRAATVRNILDFPKQFPGARTVTLEQNYRSTLPILAASNAVMEQASERYTKDLWSQRPSEQRPVLITCTDEPEQSEMVCGHIVAHLEQGIALRRQAVLFRAGHHSGNLEVLLARRNIPFHKYGGLKFIESAHIKDMLAFLRILENPYDELSWFRVLLLLDGVGPKGARKILAHLGVRPMAEEAAGESEAAVPPGPAETSERPASVEAAEPEHLVSPLRRLFDAPPRVTPAARDQFHDLRAALADCCRVKLPKKEGSPASAAGKDLPLSAQIERLYQFYEPIFRRIYENAPVRLRDLEQLQQIAAGYESRQRFITDLTLDPPTSTSDLAGPPYLEEDYLILSTIHSAKGCEWDVVHIIHAADGMIPSDMATEDDQGIDEERRLFYVAMTRAKDHLYVYFPLRYYHAKWRMGDSHSYAQLTRFLTPQVRALFESRGFRSARSGRGPIFSRQADNVQAVQSDLKRLFGQ